MTTDPLAGTRELGVSGGFGIVEPAGEPCDDCGEKPGKPHVCAMDGARHRHGMTHTLSDGLQWLCDDCYRHLIDEALRIVYAQRAEWKRVHAPEPEPERYHERIALLQRLRPLPL